ncbi:MAG: hypothetical protein JRG91_04730, partial [Deltaproteobacteria bacterium]|nr:hypothetical protein [Deltaproteobacteria bacterium]
MSAKSTCSALSLATALTVCLWTSEAGAQLFTDRILTPAGGVTSGSAAYGLALNPAAMTLNQGWELDYFHPLHLGMGFEFVRPPTRFLGAHLDAGYSSAGWTMGIFSMGLKMGRLMSFGTSL